MSMAKQQVVQNVNMSPGHKSASSSSHRVISAPMTGTITAPGKTGASNNGVMRHGKTMNGGKAPSILKSKSGKC